MIGALRRTFRSLGVRNYRFYFGGQIVSVTGTWIQQIAQQWLVLHLTGSGLALGLTAALQFLPMLVFGAWGGVLADRTDKRRLLLLTQGAAGLLAAGLAVLTLTGAVRLETVLVFALLLGLVSALDNPTRQSFASEMVGPELVSNAVSLNSTVFTTARTLGPALAGLLIGLVGTGWCFALNAASYVAVLAGIALMDPRELRRGRPLERAPGQVTAGLRYAWSRPQLRTPLLVMAVVGAFSLNFSVLLPLMARFEFHGGPQTYGLLFSLVGVGSVAGALFAAARPDPDQRRQALSAVLFGCLLGAAALMPGLVLEGAVLALMGAAMITMQSTTNSLLQINSDSPFRGRVMSLYVIVLVGTTPLGAPLVGLLAQRWGPRAGLALGGIAAALAGAAALVALRRRPGDYPGPITSTSLPSGSST